MNRRLKAVGACILALLAASALAGSAAAAEFHSESTTTYSSGAQVTENVFTTAAGKVKCKKAVFTGKGTAKTATTAQATPNYAECTGFGQAATVTMNGCTVKGTASSAVAGNVAIVCPAGKVIQVDVPSGSCSLTVAAQTPSTSSLDYKEEGSGATRSILVTSTVGGIAVTVDGGGICGSSGSATLTGSALIKGFSNEGLTTQTGVWVG